jgi:hypothetical protein
VRPDPAIGHARLLGQVLLIAVEIDTDGCQVSPCDSDEPAVDRVPGHEPVTSVIGDQHVSRSGVPASMGRTRTVGFASMFSTYWNRDRSRTDGPEGLGHRGAS